MNTTLSDSVKDMSATLGELQAKEEQLKMLIQHKVRLLIQHIGSGMSLHLHDLKIFISIVKLFHGFLTILRTGN